MRVAAFRFVKLMSGVNKHDEIFQLEPNCVGPVRRVYCSPAYLFSNPILLGILQDNCALSPVARHYDTLHRS